MKKKYIFCSLHIQCGEYEFYSNHVEQVHPRRKIEKYCKDYAKDFYGGEAEYDKELDAYFFFGGELAVNVNDYREITKEEYEVLTRFL